MTPAERAARAIHAKGGITEDLRPESCGVCRESLNDARAALTAALDVDELERLIFTFPYADGASGTVRDSAALARAVVAHLTKGDENDE